MFVMLCRRIRAAQQTLDGSHPNDRQGRRTRRLLAPSQSRSRSSPPPQAQQS